MHLLSLGYFSTHRCKEQVGSEIWQEGAVLCTMLSWLLSFLLLWRSSSPCAAYLALPRRAALVLVLGREDSASRGREGPIQLEGWHSLGVLGVRQSQQDLKACFALEI